MRTAQKPGTMSLVLKLVEKMVIAGRNPAASSPITVSLPINDPWDSLVKTETVHVLLYVHNDLCSLNMTTHKNAVRLLWVSLITDRTLRTSSSFRIPLGLSQPIDRIPGSSWDHSIPTRRCPAN